jgi:hypothetical protein
MDILYSASFYDYVKDEENIDVISRHLNSMAKDFKLPQVAAGLKWVSAEWKVESIAKLLRNIFADWLPDLAGSVFALISHGWPVSSKLNLCAAFMLIDEPPAVSAIFVRTLTTSWGKTAATKLVSYLDSVLEWDDGFFHEFILEYVESLKGCGPGPDAGAGSGVPGGHGSTPPPPPPTLPAQGIVCAETAPLGPQDVQSPESMLEAMAQLYQHNLAAADYNLVWVGGGGEGKQRFGEGAEGRRL